MEIKLPDPLNVPEVLKPYIGRKTWSVKRSEITAEMYPCFVKPKFEMKLSRACPPASGKKGKEIRSEVNIACPRKEKGNLQ